MNQRVLCCCCAVLASLATASRAFDRMAPMNAPGESVPPPAANQRSSAPPSLDDLLLQGLDSASSKRPVASKSRPAKAGVAERSAAKQTATPKPGGALSAIEQNMRNVHQRLLQKDLSDDTLVAEQQIVSQLDQIIEKLASQCRQASAPQSVGNPKPKSGGDPDPKSQAKTGSQAARDDKSSTGGRSDSINLTTEVRQSMGRVWGQLPERFRRQIQNVSRIEFLPKYRKLIEDYYRRLAEEPDR